MADTAEAKGSPYQITIHDMPSGERPRERLIHYGPAALSNAELLAILLRVGIKGENVVNLSTRLLVENDGLLGLLKADFQTLMSTKGMGEAKTCQVKAALELGRRLMLASPTERPQITCPGDVNTLLGLEMSQLAQEHLVVILLNTKNLVLKTSTVYVGNVNSSIVRTGEVFREAVRENCPAIIVVHNHPSGDPTPSPEDVHVTRRLVEAGKLLDINLLDHIIIGQKRFVSLKERGLGFEAQ
jgi:DNA repair protein RadC